MLKGEAYQLKVPYTHTDGLTYETGWIHQVTESGIFLLLKSGIADESVRSMIRTIEHKEVRDSDLIVEFSADQIGDKLPYAFGGGYAGRFANSSETVTLGDRQARLQALEQQHLATEDEYGGIHPDGCYNCGGDHPTIACLSSEEIC